MAKGLGAAIALLALFTVACTTATPTPVPPTPVPPQTFNVQVDGSSTAFNGAFTAYFPDQLSAHPGDTVQFRLVGKGYTGEPHTVTLGTLVNQGLDAAEKMGPLAGGPLASEPPELRKLTPLIPEGPGDTFQSAAQACFLASGEPSLKPEVACSASQMVQPAFNGKQTFYNSGWLEADKVFQVKLSSDIVPGAYRYICLLHREGMTGKITVVAKSTPVQTPSEAEQKGNKQLAGLVTALGPAYEQLKGAKADAAWAGFGAQEVQNALIVEFSPKPISIPVGGSVTWTVLGPHTISFNAPQDAVGAGLRAPDGSVHLNVKLFSPAGWPGSPPPPANAPPPAPNAPPTLIDAGKWDGTGFHNSGIIVSFPPALFAYKLTFTTAGTYKYQCLIHDKMEGAVKVGS